MCGIAGIAEKNSDLIFDMLKAISHRGSDDQGIWQASNTQLVLGHRRLSIVDLSTAGHQPMLSHSNRYVLSYNGEIYNHGKLKREIEQQNPSITWSGTSDTEVLLAGIETWGLKDCLRKIDGMFAFALFDKHNKVLALARDRFGEKPLFFSWANNKLAFASQLKALETLNDLSKSLNTESVKQHLYSGYSKGMDTFYETTYRLPAAHYIEFSETELLNTLSKDDIQSKLQKYVLPTQAHIATNIIDSIKERLEENVQSRLSADVPVGVFLSGGIDSSLIAAISQKYAKTIQTFTIGFKNQSYDEAPYAERVAEHLKTNHHTLYIREEDVLSRILNLHNVIDEPFGDTSIIPTSFLCEFARGKVKVALTGDGGDELFGGYSRYLIGSNISKFWAVLPSFARRRFEDIDTFLFKNRTALFEQRILPISIMVKTNRLIHRMASRNINNLAESFIGANSLSTSKLPPDSASLNEMFSPNTVVQQMMAYDQNIYLPDNILVKADRASMAFGLETRSPFLSNSLLEISIGLKNDQLIKGGEGKILLRKLLGHYLPNRLFDRPKSGFSPPLGIWLRGPLRSWANELLCDENLKILPGVDVKYANAIWCEHKKGSIDASFSLWPLISYAVWLKNRGIQH